MTPELLKLISRPEVQEKRGMWQGYDLIYCKAVSLVCSYADCHDGSYATPNCYGTTCASSECTIWLPLPIDPMDYILNRPKEERRGVWEWIDHTKAIIVNSRMEEHMTAKIENTEGFVGGSPLEILLKVYLHQKGVEG